MLSWNTIRIVVDQSQAEELVAGALHRLADQIERGAIKGFDVVVLRGLDADELVGAAVFSNEDHEKA